MFPVKGRNKTYMPQKETYVLGPQFTIQPSPVTERGSRQPDPLTQKNTDLLNASNTRCSTSSSLDGPITANLQVDHQHRNNLAHGSQRAAGVGGKRQVLPSTAFVHELSTKHGNNNPDHSSSGSIHGSDQDQQSSRSAQSGHRTQYNSSVYLPGDRVIFTENASTPGMPVVYRTPEERAANPDRLNLDRRRLAVCPILEGEDQLRLLNYQHNFITRIQNLNSLKRLIFLDLYDNQITEISGLSSLKSLRVLMLGKNRIKKINNLEALTKLDVLDLHGNEICHIDHLNHLAELRVLNLAGNRIEYVDNLSGMTALTELNLRRNNIRSVAEVDQLPNLQRLFLSFNEITWMSRAVDEVFLLPGAPDTHSNLRNDYLSFEDIQCLADSPSLAEISLDGNPFAQEPHYKQIVLRYMNHLRQFDMKPVSVDERRIATVMAKKEEEKKRESYKTAVMKERRRVAISNARRHWELMQGSAMSRLNRMNKQPPELYANHISNVPSSDASQEDDKTEENGSSRSSSSQLNSRPTSAKSLISEKEWPAGGSTKQHSRLTSRASSVSASSEKDKFSVMGDSEASYNTDFLSEIEGDTLNLYGVGALEAFDRSWGVQAAGAVTTICFKFIDFDHITKILHKIRVRFPNVNTLIFNSTNISSLAQLNALSSIRRLDNLVIEKDGNPITEFVLWRTYLLFRLAHFCLKKINDVEVGVMDTKSDPDGCCQTTRQNPGPKEDVTSALAICNKVRTVKQAKYAITIDLRHIQTTDRHRSVNRCEQSDNTDGREPDSERKPASRDQRTPRSLTQDAKGAGNLAKRGAAGCHSNNANRERHAEQLSARHTSYDHHRPARQVRVQTKVAPVRGQSAPKLVPSIRSDQVLASESQRDKSAEPGQVKGTAEVKAEGALKVHALTESKTKLLRDVIEEASKLWQRDQPDYYLWLPRRHKKNARRLRELLKPVSLDSFDLQRLLADNAEDKDGSSDVTASTQPRPVSQLDRLECDLFVDDFGCRVGHATEARLPAENIVKQILNDQTFQTEVLASLVSASDIVNAERFFGTLAHMTTSQLPQARLLALLGDKKKQLLSDEKNKKPETKLVDRTTESVGRAGLVYLSTDVLQQKQQDLSHRQKFVQHYVKQLTYDAIQSNHKLTMLHSVWPQILSDLVHTAVIEMWDTNSYMKKCLDDGERN